MSQILRRRMMYFGLELEENKTRLMEFGRFAAYKARDTVKGAPKCLPSWVSRTTVPKVGTGNSERRRKPSGKIRKEI